MTDQITLLIERVKSRLNEGLPQECIHVTSLLSYGDPPNESQLIRGKIYHYAIEELLGHEASLLGAKIESEKTHVMDYQGQKICFTPDMILYFPTKIILVEIKSRIDVSLGYAQKQTSIYKYLLSLEGIHIDECYIVDGELKFKQLNCDEKTGQKILDNALNGSILNFLSKPQTSPSNSSA